MPIVTWMWHALDDVLIWCIETMEGWGHARPQRPRAPTTAGPPGLAEAGAGPGVVEGGCQPVLACRCF